MWAKCIPPSTRSGIASGLSFHGDHEDAILLQAMSTKDTDEIERIRKMGAVVVEVVSRVADFLTSHRVADNLLMKEDGVPLVIGDVKPESTSGWLDWAPRTPTIRFSLLARCRRAPQQWQRHRSPDPWANHRL